MLKRIGVSILLVWIVASVVFMAVHLVPGDPAELLLSSGGLAPDPAAVEALRRRLGLDQPILVQYANDFLRLLQGDLGRSMKDDSSIAEAIMRRLPRTLELIAAAGLFGILIGVPAGTFAAIRRGGLFDRIASGLSALGMAIPVFVMGTLILLLFAQMLRWVPAGGYVPFAQNPWLHLKLLLDAGDDDRAASRAGGVPDHAGLGARRRLARLCPHRTRQGPWSTSDPGAARRPQRADAVVTVIGLQLGGLLGGTVLVEFVFNWPGLSAFSWNRCRAAIIPKWSRSCS